MQYRPEIDGLRAVAVIPVVLFHAGVQVFSGGYIGVDVFFVISGYLISGIILSELSTGTFSFLRFYERRARRLLPALYLTLIVATPLAWLWLLPRDLQDFSQSLTATATFTSNLLFWKEIDYFDTSVDLKPLIHTWSLAIEEQFYIIFPFLLIVLWKWLRAYLFAALFLLVLASFSYAVWLTRTDPAAAYYLLPTRGWELLLGVLASLAMRGRQQSPLPQTMRGPLAILGLGLIVLSIVTFDESTPFPGPYALIPTLGAFLVILCTTPGSAAYRLLAWKPLVAVGLVSYSVYLFHQPILAFLRYLNPAEPALSIKLFACALVFPLAFLSWRYVEMPFRSKTFISRRAVFACAASVGAVIACLGVGGHIAKGFLRFDLSDQEIAKLQSIERGSLPECPDLALCSLEMAEEDDVLLIGDSNAFHFSKALSDSLQEGDRRLFNLARGGCFPVENFHRIDKSQRDNQACDDINRKLDSYIHSDVQKPKTVILSAAWSAYYYGGSYFIDNATQKTMHNDARVFFAGDFSVDERKRRAKILAAVKARIKFLSDHFETVLVIGPLPFLTNDFRGGLDAVNDGIEGVMTKDFLEETSELLVFFDSSKFPENVAVLLPHTKVCEDRPNGRCLTEQNGYFLYADIAHVSNYGARMVFLPLIERHL